MMKSSINKQNIKLGIETMDSDT